MEPLRRWWTGQARETRIAVIGGAAALVVLAVLGASLLMGGGGDDPAVSVAPSNPSTTAPKAPGPTPPAEPLPTEDPDLPTLEALKEFVKEAGDPPNANIGRFKVPRIGVDAPIGER